VYKYYPFWDSKNVFFILGRHCFNQTFRFVIINNLLQLNVFFDLTSNKSFFGNSYLFEGGEASDVFPINLNKKICSINLDT
jgi:hypothetical protein